MTNKKKLQPLTTKSKHEALNDGIVILLVAKILDQNNLNTLLKAPKYADNVASCLESLHRGGILTPENSEALITESAVRYSSHLALSLNHLIQKNKRALTHNAFNMLVAAKKYTMPLAQGLLILSKLDNHTEESYQALVKAKEKAPYMAYCLNNLRRLGIVINPQNLQALVDNKEHLKNLSFSLDILDMAEVSPKLRLTQNNFDILLASATKKQAPSLANGWSYLAEKDIISEKRLNNLAAAEEHADDLAHCMGILHMQKLLTEDNERALIKLHESVKDLLPSLIKLGRKQKLSQNSFNALLVSPKPEVLTFDLNQASKAETTIDQQSIKKRPGLTAILRGGVGLFATKAPKNNGLATHSPEIPQDGFTL